MNQILEIQSSPQQALLYLLAFLKQQDYQFTTITPLSHQRILNRKKNEIYKHRTHQDIFGWNLNFKKLILILPFLHYCKNISFYRFRKINT